jgi:hypothetical protein
LRALARRRAVSLSIFAALSLLVALVVWGLSARLYPTPLITGWLLLTLVLLLSFFNVRKKLPFIPMGRASTWLQFHLYAGLLAAVVFLLHVGGRMPNGVLEATLAAAFVVVVLSGIVGILLSRTYAARLTSRGQEVIYERIPGLRRRVRDQAEALALKSVEQHGTTALSDFYMERLLPYFAGPRNRWLHLFESQRPRLMWKEEFAALDRYLDDDERECARELSELVWMKDDLDYHEALQGAIKLWLFVHVPLTYAMLILAVFHGFMAQAFSGSLF